MVYFKFKFEFGHAHNTGNFQPSTPHPQPNAMTFALDVAARLTAANRHKTAANYLTAVRSFANFAGRADWSFHSLTPTLLEAYQRWLCQRGLCMNTVSVYMRSLRALYNRACDADAGTGSSLFQGVYTGRPHTAKRSATPDVLQILRRLCLPQGSSLALARDLFLFSFFAMGMPFVDMAHLRKCQVHGGTIHYTRHKTAQQISVAVEPCMDEIMRRYDSDASDLVFPMLRGATPGTMPRTYANSLRAYNYSLHRLSAMVGCRQRLSSYVARHSWASLAYCNGFDLRLIAKAMGHTKLSTTLIYIRTLLDPTLADANRGMIRKLGLDSKI